MLRVVINRNIIGSSLNRVAVRFSSSSEGHDEASKANNATPVNMSAELGPISRYLVYKYSSKEYKSMDQVPRVVPTHELYNARDKGRASLMFILVGFTILGSIVAGMWGKTMRDKGVRHTDDLIKQHSEYSKVHQDMMKYK